MDPGFVIRVKCNLIWLKRGTKKTLEGTFQTSAASI